MGGAAAAGTSDTSPLPTTIPLGAPLAARNPLQESPETGMLEGGARGISLFSVPERIRFGHSASRGARHRRQSDPVYHGEDGRCVTEVSKCRWATVAGRARSVGPIGKLKWAW